MSGGRFVSAAPDCIRTRDTRWPLDRIVIHTMEGTIAGSVAWFATPGRSPPTAAHYLVGKMGDIVQMVPDDRKALHCGSKTESGWNDRSLGVEHEGHTADLTFPDAMLRSSTRVVAILCRKFKIPVDRTHIIGHVEVPGATHTDPGPNWPWPAFMDLVHAA